VGLGALEGVHSRAPFDEGQAIEHGKNTNVDAVILCNSVVEFTEFGAVSNGCFLSVSGGGVDCASI